MYIVYKRINGRMVKLQKVPVEFRIDPPKIPYSSIFFDHGLHNVKINCKKKSQSFTSVLNLPLVKCNRYEDLLHLTKCLRALQMVSNME